MPKCVYVYYYTKSVLLLLLLLLLLLYRVRKAKEKCSGHLPSSCIKVSNCVWGSQNYNL